MKPLSDRKLVMIGVVGIAVIGLLSAGALNFNKLPLINSGTTYSAYFAELGGLTSGAPVQVSGFKSGQVTDIQLRPEGVLVTFRISGDIRLGENSEAAIKTISLLGNKVVDVTPRGAGQLHEPIPLTRTVSPYQLPDAVGDLTTTISGLDTKGLSASLSTLSDTLRDTPPQLKLAVEGIARFSQTINQRDDQLRGLLENARTATTVLADRTDTIVRLIHDTNALLTQLRSQSAALDEISGNVSALAQQVRGFIGDNRTTLKPALDKLNEVLTIVDNRRDQLKQSITGFRNYVMGLGEAVSSGPFFKAYLANLLPGQFLQPFIDAAFSDLGLDPNTLSPSQRTDPQVGQPGTPPLPVPFPRTGQAGDPRMTLPDAITGNPADQQCGPPGIPLPGPGCYPYREPQPAPAPGGPPPGPPAELPPGPPETALPTPSPVFVPAPGEPVPHSTDGNR
ncbi:phospholipid/cholesterol/gamma-HCH transport system substrate-binding protein [Mycobacterium sp. OAS707]|uniref:MCE family protein n=1 Tax=Mycobacterium sp. OAS707 TaxID=2663822 RepID=UPI00178B76C5|nr:MCE family protein [Mycobacterium sp. OAS707]MBE1551751.1 phospholipid/cholesterol/gamma-HCH transport system substrate-binding protein [Mycobacterium sp. OAS707]